MKRIIYSILTAISLIAGTSTAALAQNTETLFPYPTPPEELSNLYQRCNYLVDHFWDKCNLTTAFLSKQRLNNAFGDWVGFMPYATADTVHMAIDKLVDKVKKSGPNTLTLARMAESWLWSDTAEIRSEELYLPFAKAAANHKKISGADRARFSAHIKQIENSSVGSQLPSLKLTAPDGTKSLLSDYDCTNLVIFFNDPDCTDCNMARVRLSANHNAKRLIEAGKLTILSIYPGNPDDTLWLAAATEYPDNWIVVAAPDADEFFDLRETPAIYLANNRT
ncbi:MAG: DUF5106 domain-containing protein, partial [Muribaculaceae bacterium]|nr:DUF5106 domain-containing protein [Muribaculaceae bacterium]